MQTQNIIQQMNLVNVVSHQSKILLNISLVSSTLLSASSIFYINNYRYEPDSLALTRYDCSNFDNQLWNYDKYNEHLTISSLDLAEQNENKHRYKVQ